MVKSRMAISTGTHPPPVNFKRLADRKLPSTTPNPTPIPTAAGSGKAQISRMAMDKRKVVNSMSADTAIP